MSERPSDGGKPCIPEDAEPEKPKTTTWQVPNGARLTWDLMAQDAEASELPEIHDAECCGTCKNWEKVVFFDGNCMRREQKPVTIIKHCPLYERKEQPR